MTEIGKLQNSFDWAFRTELAQLRRAIEANRGQLSPGAECEDEVARASLCVARSRSHEEPLQSAKIASSYSREQIYPPPREEKEQEAIMRTPEAVMQTASAFVEALALAADDLKETKIEKQQHRSFSALAESASKEASAAALPVSARDHPFKFGPNSIGSDNPYQQKTNSASELDVASASCTDRSYGESGQQSPCEVAQLPSGMTWKRSQPDKSQLASKTTGKGLDTGSGSKASRDSSLWKPLAGEAQGSVHQVQVSQSDELRSAGAKTQSGCTSFYAPQNDGSKSQPKHSSVGPLHGNNIFGEDLLLSLQVPLMDDVGSSMGQLRAPDNPGEKIRGLASQETLAAAGPPAAAAAAAAASTASFRWQEQQQQQKQQKQPTLQSRNSEKAHEDAIRIRHMKPRSSSSLNLPAAAMSSTSAPTPGSDRPLQKVFGRRRDQGLDLGHYAHVRARSHSPETEKISLA